MLGVQKTSQRLICAFHAVMSSWFNKWLLAFMFGQGGSVKRGDRMSMSRVSIVKQQNRFFRFQCFDFLSQRWLFVCASCFSYRRVAFYILLFWLTTCFVDLGFVVDDWSLASCFPVMIHSCQRNHQTSVSSYLFWRCCSAFFLFLFSDRSKFDRVPDTIFVRRACTPPWLIYWPQACWFRLC